MRHPWTNSSDRVALAVDDQPLGFAEGLSIGFLLGVLVMIAVVVLL